jgi:putative transposase
MIDRDHDLPVARQARVVNNSRGSVYDKPRPVSAEDLALTRRIDELHLEHPFAGARMLRDILEREGFPVDRRSVHQTKGEALRKRVVSWAAARCLGIVDNRRQAL